jgi:predicted RNase H-like nuclease (RuvC/YqgF family)
MMDVNDQMSRIASELGSKFELLSDYSNVMVLKKPVDIQRIVKSGSNRAQVKIRALENALASLDDELNEKDMEYKELRRRIRELREKTRKISVE